MLQMGDKRFFHNINTTMRLLLIEQVIYVLKYSHDGAYMKYKELVVYYIVSL